MSCRYTIAPEARQELRAIHSFIAIDNRQAARKMGDRFFEAFRLLAQNPLIGELRPMLGSEIRIFCVEKYVIIYQPSHAGVRITHVIHSARDIDRLLGVDR